MTFNSIDSPEKCLFVAVDGPGGSGKSTLAEQIAHGGGMDPLRQVVHTDHYFEPAANRGVEVVAGTPGGFNSGRFMEEVGSAINDVEKEIIVREYDWVSKAYIERTPPTKHGLVVVEGIKLIGLPVDWDVRVWVHTPREVREQRFLDRLTADRRMKETDQDVLRTRFNLWADDAEEYERKISPHNRPDIVVVSGEVSPEAQLRAVAEAIRAKS